MQIYAGSGLRISADGAKRRRQATGILGYRIHECPGPVPYSKSCTPAPKVQLLVTCTYICITVLTVSMHILGAFRVQRAAGCFVLTLTRIEINRARISSARTERESLCFCALDHLQNPKHTISKEGCVAR